MAVVALLLHLETLDTGEPSWWAESTEVPGFYAAGRSFAEVDALAFEALRAEYGPDVRIRWTTSATSERATAGFRDHSDAALRIPV